MRYPRFVCIFGLMLAVIAGSFVVGDEMPRAPVVTAAKGRTVGERLHDMSVSIVYVEGDKIHGGGSGVFKITNDGQVWILGCGHVLEEARKEVVTAEGKKTVEFDPVYMYKPIIRDGVKTGEVLLALDVIRYSKDTADDLALMRVRDNTFKPAASVNFYLEKRPPPLGARILHCGSPGSKGEMRISDGIVSMHGRLLPHITPNPKTIFDVTSAIAYPGSSGGPVVLESDGRYVGTLVRDGGARFSMFVPMRRIQDWAKRVKVEFIFDDNLPVPSDEELFKTPLDDTFNYDAPVPAPAAQEGPVNPRMQDTATINAIIDYIRQLLP